MKKFGSEIFWVKKIWVGNCSGSKKFGSEIFLGKKKLGRKSLWVKRIWVGNFLGSTKNLVKHFFGSKKFAANIFFGLKKKIGLKKKFGSKKFGSKDSNLVLYDLSVLSSSSLLTAGGGWGG